MPGADVPGAASEAGASSVGKDALDFKSVASAPSKASWTGQGKHEVAEKELKSVGEGGTSGHSNVRRFRFAFAAYGPYAAGLVVFFAKDMYILKLGANTERVGIIATSWSALFPLFYPLAGQLMDREPPLLAIRGWGRRAPWFLSHLIPLAITVALIYLPGLAWTPPAGSWVLEAWLGVFLFIAGWCMAVLLDTVESARAEIYPFGEERALVEAMTKFVGSFAATTGIVPQFLLWMVFTMSARVMVSVLLLVCLLLSLEAVPVLCDAQQPRDTRAKHSLREALTVLARAPMAHATALRFWYAAADTAGMNFAIYYLTFSVGLNSTERTKYMFLCGAIVACLEIFILTPLWGVAWSGEGSSRLARFVRRVVPPMRPTCMVLHVVAALATPVLMKVIPWVAPGARPLEWIVCAVFTRICFSPQTFFRTNAFCWAVDEDCHLVEGQRREAIHAGTVKLFEDEGRALVFLFFIGLGVAGLQTRNCEIECDGITARADCVNACEEADILRQPPAVAQYVDAMLVYVVPVFSLLCALHIWLYPIHGDRLQKLTQSQGVVFKKVVVEPQKPGQEPPPEAIQPPSVIA